MNLSIRDNILFYSQSHTDEDLEKVLRLVKLEEWIKKLPEGLDTVVGERANAVSGGERQRILLARALLRNPKILFLMKALLRWTSIRKKRLWIIFGNFIRMQREFFITHRENCLEFV